MRVNDCEFRVVKFSFFSAEDPCSMHFRHEICWSRIYEYPFVLDEISAMRLTEPNIHNCSWGFQDIHLVFKTWLDVSYRNVVHSDVRPSTLFNTVTWDITTVPAESLHNRFDVVINISTLEEVNADHIELLKNHLIQVKREGRFICTFDYPGLQLDRIEEFVGEKIVTPPRRLTPRTSRLEDKVLGLADDFGVGYLVLERQN